MWKGLARVLELRGGTAVLHPCLLERCVPPASAAGTPSAAPLSCSSLQHPHPWLAARASVRTTRCWQHAHPLTWLSLMRQARSRRRLCCQRCSGAAHSSSLVITTSCRRWCWTLVHRLAGWASACSVSCVRHTLTLWSSCSSSTGWQVGPTTGNGPALEACRVALPACCTNPPASDEGRWASLIQENFCCSRIA